MENRLWIVNTVNGVSDDEEKRIIKLLKKIGEEVLVTNKNELTAFEELLKDVPKHTKVFGVGVTCDISFPNAVEFYDGKWRLYDKVNYFSLKGVGFLPIASGDFDGDDIDYSQFGEKGVEMEYPTLKKVKYYLELFAGLEIDLREAV